MSQLPPNSLPLPTPPFTFEQVEHEFDKLVNELGPEKFYALDHDELQSIVLARLLAARNRRVWREDRSRES
jgi:hypothetical protein